MGFPLRRPLGDVYHVAFSLRIGNAISLACCQTKILSAVSSLTTYEENSNKLCQERFSTYKKKMD